MAVATMRHRLALWAARLDNAPTAAVCCNVCRPCVTTNLVALALGLVGAAGAALWALLPKRARPW